MGTIKARISGEAQDVQAFCEFLEKISDNRALPLIWLTESADYQNRNSSEVRRYLEVRFDA